jgi:hypothetical protein
MGPKPGDVLIRAAPATPSAFIVLDACSERLVAGPLLSLNEALRTARQLAGKVGGVIWQQPVDERGRPLGPVLRLEEPSR